MGLTRRRFLVLTAAAAGALGALGVLGRRRLVRRWLHASLAPTPPGPLDDAVVRTMLSATRTLLGEPLEIAHYEDYFRWRAQNLPGYRSLYGDFAAALDRAAQGSFVSAPPVRQRRILAEMLPVRGWSRLGRGLFGRDTERFAHFVVLEVFQRFTSTDAWLRIGYESWPGTPRGFDFYQRDSKRS
jgi:hypothetical protein